MNKIVNVLIVEDDPIAGETIRDIVTGMGCEYVMAEDGKQALTYLEQHSYDLIILDIGLPEINGLEVLRTARKTRRDLPPVIVITGYDSYEKEAESLGVFAFLLKAPLPVLELRDAILRATNSQN